MWSLTPNQRRYNRESCEDGERGGGGKRRRREGEREARREEEKRGVGIALESERERGGGGGGGGESGKIFTSSSIFFPQEELEPASLDEKPSGTDELDEPDEPDETEL